MGKYRTQQVYFCPYCSLAGWLTHTARDNHVRKSHAGKPIPKGVGRGAPKEKKDK